MTSLSAHELTEKKCRACEGGVEAYTAAEAQAQLAELPSWTLAEDGKSIARELQASNFVRAMGLLNRAAEIAEEDQHHPDLHLTGYRQVRIELTTHAIGGLSENDFILAAKLDAAAKELGL